MRQEVTEEEGFKRLETTSRETVPTPQLTESYTQNIKHQLLFNCFCFLLRSSCSRLRHLLISLLEAVQTGLHQVGIRLQGDTADTVARAWQIILKDSPIILKLFLE